MKKRSAKNESRFKRLFNKMGMTYVELICALALLSLIVMMFTPMLLSSYEQLYAAGEKVEELYESKEDMEKGLAVRSSTITSNMEMTFSYNSEKLFEKFNVVGRKIVSNLQGGLETVFHGARARVDILTPTTVYDDTSWHKVIIQTTGLEWDAENWSGSEGDVIVFNHNNRRNGDLGAIKESLKPGQILVDIIKPDKSTSASEGSTLDENVYRLGGRVDLLAFTEEEIDEARGRGEVGDDYVQIDPRTHRITFKISGVDFTNSPLKIVVYYINERGKLKTLSDYMYINPAHIIFAGESSGSDYFTSAGIERVDASTGETETTKYVLNIEGRGMSVHNSPLLTGGTPTATGSVIKTVEWIANDENSAFNPYYVLAGTNGSVYRMYNMNTMENLGTVLYGEGTTINATTDYSYSIDTGERINPSFWSGEISDQYSFQTMYQATTYGAAGDNTTDCSAPNSSYGVVGTQYDEFDTKLRYSMVFNSFRTAYKYASQTSRRISYTLTEAGNKSFRISGKKYSTDDFTGYNSPWEPDYYKYTSSGTTASTDDERAIYFGGVNWPASNKHTDKNLAYIRIHTYTQINPLDALEDDGNKIYYNNDTGYESLYSRLVTGGEFWSPPGYSEQSVSIDQDVVWKNRVNYIDTDYGLKVNVTSAAYLPGSSSTGSGQVIYFGTVPAYALLRQSSDPEQNRTIMYNTAANYDRNFSAATIYLLCGSNDAGTTIYRNSYGGRDGNRTENVDAHNVMRSDIANSYVEELNDEVALYNSNRGDSVTYKYNATDLEFTLGYCSRWRMTIGNVTYNGLTEEFKSYEKYYTASHTNANYQRKPGINYGTTDNLYYQVWFPGEFYNLTETATLDEVTVAVGYTVSGSTYMSESWINVNSGYYGTALGSVYNDGVLAAYTSTGNKISDNLSGKGEQNIIFQNLLYYKSPNFKDSTTHSRDSVRFNVVGLNAESTKTSDTAGTKEYYAYYGDSNGRLWRSYIGKAEVTFVSGDTEENDTVTESVTLVDSIPDTKLDAGIHASQNNLGMEEITFTNTGSGISWGGKSFKDVFSEITSIECNDDIIIVTGKPQEASENFFGSEYTGFAVGVKDSDGNWTWKLHAMQFVEGSSDFLTGYKVNCAKIIGNYYYAGSDGWFGGINLDVLRKLVNGVPVPIDGYNENSSDDRFLWTDTQGAKIYAIGGYSTN